MSMVVTAPGQVAIGPNKPRPHRATRVQLSNRKDLDGRTGPAKNFDRLVADIKSDLGGADQLSTIKTRLIEAFASSAVVLDDNNVRLLLGQPVDLTEQAQVILAMVRVGSRLGLERKAKPIPTLADYLASKEPGE